MTIFAAFALLAVTVECAAAVIDSASASQRGAVVELEFGTHGKGLAWALSAHGNELWIDLEHTRIDLPPRPLYGRELAPVTLVRAIDPGGTHSRLVIQVAGKTDYAVGKLPHELLIRLAPSGQAPNLAAPVLIHSARRRGRAAAAAAPVRPAAEMSAPVPQRLAAVAPPQAAQQRPNRPASIEPARASATAVNASAAEAGAGTGDSADSSGVRLSALYPPGPGGQADTAPRNAGLQKHHVVVIDPGHGGYDSGTRAGAPLMEKDIALQIALRLRGELEKRGVHAILTRTTDDFVTLGDRTAFANRNDAELFVSIHLNSSPDPSAAGIESYYLNNTTDRATIRLAAMENASGASYGAPAGGDLNYILTDMRQQYKANESVALASMIEAQTSADIESSLGLKVAARGAMRGPFYVLVGAQMPAVLVECGFLSNREEASRLATAQYQQVIALGIAEAVTHYFNADAAVGNL